MPGIEARAPERTETSSGLAGVAEAAPGLPPDLATAASTCAARSGGIGLSVGVEVGADLGRDGEARAAPAGRATPFRRDWRPCPPSRFFISASSFGALRAEGVDPFRHRLLRKSIAGRPRRSARAHAAPCQTSPSRAVKQQVDAEQGSQHIDAVQRPMIDDDQTEQDGHRGGDEDQCAGLAAGKLEREVRSARRRRR